MRWVVVPRKGLVLSFLVLLAALLAYWGFRQQGAEVRVQRESLLETALKNTRASKSYRYRIDTRLPAAGTRKDDYLSRFTGEFVAPDRAHVKGSLVKTPMEFIQVGENAYVKDFLTGKWFVLQGNRLMQSELFVTEVNPTAVFNFKDVPQMRYLGRKKVDGKKYEALEVKPLVHNPYLETQFTDFTYLLYIDPKETRLGRAEIEAYAKSDRKQKLEVTIEFWDYNKPIKIEPPPVG
ncbi:MAG: Uncharacterized protein XD69_0582 [Clostridia bacterium 62_21]|nr:MAG: Uncharacterized protein XD69_0582 [Clostridia bacterium 62_21]HAG06840.1 hypothetical protein [Peptococcaceae bacterium]